MTETKPIVVYTADCVGNAANCRYPNEVKITDEVSAKQAFSTDMVCARYKNHYRSTANFEVANALPGDCDNDHSEIAAEWITPEDIADLFADVPYVLHYSRHQRLRNPHRLPWIWRRWKRSALCPCAARENTSSGAMRTGRNLSTPIWSSLWNRRSGNPRYCP